MSLKLGTSGVRGTYVELTPQTAAALSEAFSTYVDSGSVAVAMDTRPSSEYLKHAAISGLIATGALVDDFGILPTPILQWLIRHFDYAGGVVISGGHASFNRNSLIFLNRMGGYLSPYEIEEFFNLYHSTVYARKNVDQLGKRDSGDELDAYFEALASGRRKESTPLRFAIDCSNGATGRVLNRLSSALLHTSVLRCGCRFRPCAGAEPIQCRHTVDRCQGNGLRWRLSAEQRCQPGSTR